MLENRIENALKREVEKRGGIAYKFTSGVTGVPDRLVLLWGEAFFIETKRPKGGVLSERQKYEMSRITKAGTRCYVLSSLDMLPLVMADMDENKYPELRYVPEY